MGVIQHDLPSLVMSEKSKRRKEAKGNLTVYETILMVEHCVLELFWAWGGVGDI